MSLRRRLAWLALYALAMGWLEAVVVVYLRAIYYPGGFGFPLVPLPAAMAAVEMAREVATLVMIFAVARLAAAGAWDAFLNFAFVFGLWDLAYYAGLKLTLGWPQAWTTPDLLFLIPVPWVGPVLAPIIVSFLLVGGSVTLIRAHPDAGTTHARLRPREWGTGLGGGMLILLSFTIDAGSVLAGGAAPPFRWWLFGSGVLLGGAALAAVVTRFRGIMNRPG